LGELTTLYNAPPDILTGFKGLLIRETGRVGKGRGRMGRKGTEREKCREREEEREREGQVERSGK